MSSSLATRPRAAIALYTDGTPWYPYRARSGAGPVYYTATPQLPDDPHVVWSDLHRKDIRLHIDLFDERVLAELLYCTPGLIEAGSVGSDTLMDQIQHTLVVCRCNPNVLAGWIAAEYGDHLYDLRPNGRMAACRAKARQLTVEAAQVGGGGVGC